MTELTDFELDAILPRDEAAPARATSGATLGATPGVGSIAALDLRRRDALALVFGAAVATRLLTSAAHAESSHSATAIASLPFAHGVASGDPLQDRVIIWTRVSPLDTANIAVTWAMSTHALMKAPFATGSATADAASDFTVKVDVTGLAPGQVYFYQFTTAGGAKSPIGRTITLPASDSLDPLELAVFSCTNFEKGYFNAYADAATRKRIRVVLHLGDYNYEYGPGAYATPALSAGVAQEPRAALLNPPSETVTLDAYRLRKALYRSDTDLQALHARAPWITIWDDHESANDEWTGGAQNHNPLTQGDWQTRKIAAVQAYYEWLPIREPADGNRIDPVTGNPAHMYRSFDFGKLMRLTMLDTRMAGRNLQLSLGEFVGVYTGVDGAGPFPKDVQSDNVTPRTLMGTAQEAWFDNQMASSNQIWQVIGSQIITHFQITPDYTTLPILSADQQATITSTIDSLFFAGAGAAFASFGKLGLANPATADSWNGYPSARLRFYASLKKAKNPVVISGDSHNFWVANLALPKAGGGTDKIAVELAGGSVTSPGYEQEFYSIPGGQLAAIFQQSSQAKSATDKLMYADIGRRGYMVLHVSPARVVGSFIFVSTVYSHDYKLSGRQFEVLAGARQFTV